MRLPARSLVITAAASLAVFAAVAVAWASLKLYDEPVRRWLSRKVLARA